MPGSRSPRAPSTDLVGHTEMMQRLGDTRRRDVLREHERITRETLRVRGGTEIKTAGDSFMVSFGSVAKAVECAVALQRTLEAHNQSASEPITVRMGLNSGEPIEEDGDLFGATVILASRIAGEGGGWGDIGGGHGARVVFREGVLFADRGEFVAKGFEEPVRVYEVVAGRIGRKSAGCWPSRCGRKSREGDDCDGGDRSVALDVGYVPDRRP